MNLVFFTHPDFLYSQSMPRFARFLSEGMEQRGHQVEIWTPEARFFAISAPTKLKKWLAYADQFLVFPLTVKQRLKNCPPETLFIFTDQALGPWVPLVADRPHVIHCHDFLAQRSARGEIAENPTGWTGRKYQTYIRRGYGKGKNFISVSLKTRDDLHEFLGSVPSVSEMVYNGLNQDFVPMAKESARQLVSADCGLDLSQGYILHVGGNQWYKNRGGVIIIYNAWREKGGKLPLIMIGEMPDDALKTIREQSTYRDSIHFFPGLDDITLRHAYAGAAAFLFPSMAEGFGWPIAEAMASGCLVLTTDEAPMTEVAGGAAFLIPRQPSGAEAVENWSKSAADVLNRMLSLEQKERFDFISAGIKNALRFHKESSLDQIERLYMKIIGNAGGAPSHRD